MPFDGVTIKPSAAQLIEVLDKNPSVEAAKELISAIADGRVEGDLVAKSIVAIVNAALTNPEIKASLSSAISAQVESAAQNFAQAIPGAVSGGSAVAGTKAVPKTDEMENSFPTLFVLAAIASIIKAKEAAKQTSVTEAEVKQTVDEALVKGIVGEANSQKSAAFIANVKAIHDVSLSQDQRADARRKAGEGIKEFLDLARNGDLDAAAVLLQRQAHLVYETAISRGATSEEAAEKAQGFVTRFAMRMGIIEPGKPGSTAVTRAINDLRFG